MTDLITILKCSGTLNMTKTWEADGTLRPYDKAALFRVMSKPVSSIQELHSLLARLQTEPQCCVIRGQFVGKDKALAIFPVEKEGYYRRQNQLFEEVRHHWVLIDIDGYRPIGADPVLEPVKAIDEYIRLRLPKCFQGASYSWQQSCSSGHAYFVGVLKVHVWFWLARPYTGPELSSWARVDRVELDVSVLRRVQPHYTAAPVFAEGVIDPVPTRIGYEAGWEGDEVDLELSPDILDAARHFAADAERELIDPTEKPELIGAFCLAYAIEEIIERWLSDVFEFQAGSERRLNFLQGGGTPGGAFVDESREYVVNMHNSDPLENRAANKWDLVRTYCYGYLDEGKDSFELMDMAGRPSQIAMTEMVSLLPEVNRILVARQADKAQDWQSQISLAETEVQLRELTHSIAIDRTIDRLARDALAACMKQRFKEIGQKVGIGTLRNLLDGKAARPTTAQIEEIAPDWAKPWVYLTDCDRFFNLETKLRVTEQGFNAEHTRFMVAFADPRSGKLPAASRYCLDHWHMPCVAHVIYMPVAGPVFEMNGISWANLYKPGSVPPLEECPAAVEVVQEHLQKLLADDRERRIFTSWLAHNVQHPGVKIRWAPYLHGFEGDGKSYFHNLLDVTLGPGNTRAVSGATLESDFTDWAIGNAVIVIEEMKQHGHNRYDIMNRVKPFITNERVDFHPKGKASYEGPNTANYLILSNYLDGAPIQDNDRRYFFLSSAIDPENLSEMVADGYFTRLFDTLVNHPGALRKWLLEYELDMEFEPNGRAPYTETKALVLELTRSDTEIVAMDIIEAGAEGIHPRALCSGQLAWLIKGKMGEEAKVNTSQINSLLAKLGFSFLGRRYWAGSKHRIWFKGDRNFEKIKLLLDSTLDLDE